MDLANPDFLKHTHILMDHILALCGFKERESGHDPSQTKLSGQHSSLSTNMKNTYCTAEYFTYNTYHCHDV